MKLFSTEQVSKYHPDKYCDQISDAILAACLRGDRHSHCGIEVMAKGNVVVLGGEITTNAAVDYESIVRRVANKLGYKIDSIINLISKQSPEINAAVNESSGKIGAGDQGIMYGYACSQTKSWLPYGFDMANRVIKAIEDDVEHNPETILKGDAKTQITVDLDKPVDESLETTTVSVCHIPKIGAKRLKEYIADLLARHGIEVNKLVVNPGGAWTIGGPTADCGLTGRKIVCDQYGGYAPVGGGAFSGKDPTKLDRSGAYMARHIAKYLVITDSLVNEATVQLGYVIGRSEPVSIDVRTNDSANDEARVRMIKSLFDLSPSGIIKFLDLYTVDYEKIAEGCVYYER